MRKLTINRSSFSEYREVLNGREAFKTSGSLWGGPVAPGGSQLGQLPHSYHNSARKADYVVFSYETPIAWHEADGGWVVPDVRYSVTTSKSQGKIRAAIGEYES